MEPVKIGIIGCGNISGIYLERTSRNFPLLKVAACADLLRERAEEKALEWEVPRVCSVEELLGDSEIELVINLTVPQAHHAVSLSILQAGKAAYGEKPLALTRKQGQELLEAAKKAGKLLGSAPDTFLGGGIQTCRKLIDDGWIGRPVAANAFMMGHGPESWHPNAEFYYKPGGGPMFDMGPYYLTALINLLGPARSVMSAAKMSFKERVITAEVNFGKKIDVEVPTHITGVLEFDSGAVATMTTSFDVWAHRLPCIEIHGTDGSLSVPDPNGFSGPVLLRRAGQEEWKEIPLAFGYAENYRGLGVADMAVAIRTGRSHRASGQLAYHVLDIMHAFHDSSAEGRRVSLESTCTRPAPLPMGLRDGMLDD